jgi:carbamoyl-phosphate synthase large subunit
MRTAAEDIPFAKMHDCGNDYIFIENFDGRITSPESLCVTLCEHHYGIGADGIVLIEHSDTADAKMRSFNKDGSEGRMAGNNLRCVAKYLYDKKIAVKDVLNIETAEGIKTVHVYTNNGRVGTVSVEMGDIHWNSEQIPAAAPVSPIIDMPYELDGETYRITCLSVGNPHCVIFRKELDALDLEQIGPKLEYAPIFPDRANIEFVRVVDAGTLRVRVWERGNGATLACGTGACAAVVAAVENGFCDKGTDVRVTLPGGDLIVNYTDERVVLTGSANVVFSGTFEY